MVTPLASVSSVLCAVPFVELVEVLVVDEDDDAVDDEDEDEDLVEVSVPPAAPTAGVPLTPPAQAARLNSATATSVNRTGIRMTHLPDR